MAKQKLLRILNIFNFTIILINIEFDHLLFLLKIQINPFREKNYDVIDMYHNRKL